MRPYRVLFAFYTGHIRNLVTLSTFHLDKSLVKDAAPENAEYIVVTFSTFHLLKSRSKFAA